MTSIWDLLAIIGILLVLFYLRARHANLWKTFRRTLHLALGIDGHRHQSQAKRDQLTEDLNARDREEKKL